MEGLFILIGLVAIGWFWLDSSRAHEIAVGVSRASCERVGVQLLDDTVALDRLSLRRGKNGAMRLHRAYRFDFSDTGDRRQSGSITLLGTHVEHLVIGNDILS